MPKPKYREPAKKAPTSVALACKSLHKSHYCAKGSSQGYSGVVLSRRSFHRMEVFWHTPVDPRKTCVLMSSFPASTSWHSLISIAGSGKSVIWSVISRLLLIGTYFSSVPPSLKILWLFAKLDQPSWPTFTSISGILRSKAVATCCFLSYINFLLALGLAVTFSTAFMRHTKGEIDSRVMTFWRNVSKRCWDF